MTSTNRNVESEYIDINAKNGWAMLYQSIREESSKYDFKCLEARKPQNRTLNRYRDVNPFDDSRVVLSRGPCDYINANLVKVERANRQYILTQGPLAETVGHFWLMIWEQNSKAVLMLNKLIEQRQVKCHCYWPIDVGGVLNLDSVGLKLEFLSFQDNSYYCTRQFKLTDIESKTSREIQQFHYTTWPDFGVPSSPTAFLEFLRNVRQSGALENDVGPAVVHCSAGIGRSGTFCLVDSCLILIEKFGLNAVDVKEILLDMRKYRMGLIQTPDQLRFSYQAIIEGAKRLLLNSDSEQFEEFIYDCTVSDEDDEDDNEPPPLPPPRGDSLTRSQQTTFENRPLPTIPNSTSMNDSMFNDSHSDVANSNIIMEDVIAENCTNGPPQRPLPGVPQDNYSDNDSLNSTEDLTNHKNSVNEVSGASSPTSELRQRSRLDRKEQLSKQIQDIKRKQQAAEKWADTKRSLSRPFYFGLSVLCLLGGGAIAYAYFKG